MYTRCPKCSTVFRITAAQLRIAEGEVRCGNCTISFNALTELTDDLPELTDAEPAIGRVPHRGPTGCRVRSCIGQAPITHDIHLAPAGIAAPSNKKAIEIRSGSRGTAPQCASARTLDENQSAPSSARA